ncbi:hypothetical protein [Metabacillus fastidiosus]|uniref:hypothetical protein n=1 Tax=Metabacillus fastidiosus TaxID=1458 RepID=UPI002E1A486F|nr:hypothetical protein [Metabacillus fastidiosus]
MIKKFLSNFIILSFFSILSIFSFSVKVQAEEFNLPFDVKTNGVLTEEIKENNYSVKVTQAGRLFLDMTSYVDSRTSIIMYDSSNNEVFSNYKDGDSLTPSIFKEWVDVEPGIYRIKIYNSSSWYKNTGKYQITASFTAANNNETEPNNGTVEAQSLAFNQTITGFLSWDNKVDFYKISVPNSGNVKFDMSSYVDSRTSIALMDSNNNEVFAEYVDGGSQTPARYPKSVDLDKGIYYLKIYNGSSYYRNTGKYIIKTSFTSAKSNEKEPNNGTIEAQVFTYNKPITGFLSWDDKFDFYKLNVSVPGRVSIDLTSYVDSRAWVELIDNNNKSVLETYVDGDSANPGKLKKSIELEAGIYYLKIYNGSSYYRNTGKYVLNITPPPNKHIGRVLIRSSNQYLYKSNGSKDRKLRQQEGLRVYKVLKDRYDVGAGYYVKKTKDNLFYIGHIWSKEYSMSVYTSEGWYFKSFSPRQTVRAYGYSNGRYEVGGGYYIKASDDIQLDR